MKYEFNPYHEHIPDNALVEDLIKTAEKADCSPLTQKKHNELGQFSSEKIVYRFGSWNGALEKAGLPTSVNRQYSNQELLDNIQRVWQAKGKQPVRSDMNNSSVSTISSGAYLRRFGTWTEALRSFVDCMDSEDTSKDGLNSDNASGSTSKAREVNLRLRWKVMRRDNFKCCLCGASPAKDPSVELHIDHIIPWSKGGETTMDNLRTLCSKCNLGKSNLIE